MSRGMLDDSDWEKVDQKIPDLDNLQDITNICFPDSLSIAFSHQSNVPIASVCLREAADTLLDARYALREIFAHRIWYLEKTKPPDNISANSFGLYYADDAVLRLYSAGEHLASGIIMMLDITDEDLKPFKRKGKQGNEKSSKQIYVGHYLRDKMKDHPITKAIIKLADSKDWEKTRNHRDKWVHEQPPTVKELGRFYERLIRWESSPTGKGYTLRGGRDEPEYSIDEILGFIQSAMFKFTDTLTFVFNFYIDLLRSRGLNLTFDKTSSTIGVKIF